MEKDTERICIANEASAMGRKSVSDDGENAHEVGGKRRFERIWSEQAYMLEASI